MSVPFEVGGPVEVIAHRGYSARAPENTLAALELAIDVGADALEFDVVAAADGTAFLFHDETLERTTNGTGRIRDRPSPYLETLDAGAWFSPAYRGEPVPDLRGALGRVRGRTARVYLEIKEYRSLDDVDGMVEAVVREGVSEATVFISLDWTALDRVRLRQPRASIGYVVERASRIPEALERARGDAAALLDFDARLLLADPGSAGRARAAGIELAAWTVNDAGDAARLLAMGVPRITTDEVEVMLDWKRTL